MGGGPRRLAPEDRDGVAVDLLEEVLARADHQGTLEFRIQPHGLDTGCR
jgi:hypothetical protein